MLDPSDIEAKKDALIWSARRCFDRGLQTNAGGNLSVRLSSGAAIVIKPSKDMDFHLDLYRIRPDINAIVHCHSPWATGFASAGIEIPCLTVQTIEKIGRMPLIPLSENGGPQTEVEISPVFQDASVRAAVLANHGTIGVGKTLTAAQYLVEIIEETAHIAFVRDTLMAAHGKTMADLPTYGTAKDARAAANG